MIKDITQEKRDELVTNCDRFKLLILEPTLPEKSKVRIGFIK